MRLGRENSPPRNPESPAITKLHPDLEGFTFLTVRRTSIRARWPWSIGSRRIPALVLEALDMAHGQRCPRGVIRRGDNGAHCTSIAFGKGRPETQSRPSMGSAGDCYHNAL